jgi:RND family efflux transporter MFP subunit
MQRKRLKVVVPFVVLIVGAAMAAMLAAARKTPPRVERPSLGPLVDVVPAVSGDVSMAVTGHGEVVPKVAVDVVPQVAGQVVEVHPGLVAGGFFSAGDALVVIDPRDYELALERAQAAVARAEVVIERERAEADVARQEWDALSPGEEPSSGLVVREPQVRQAEAELEAARADLDFARLNLERTRIRLPFDGVVVSKSVDLGQFVSSGRALARVYGTDAVEVRVPLESRELAWFDVPISNGDRGPRVELSASFAGKRYTWEGRVVRMEGQVDASSRMVHVVVDVPRPYARDEGRPPLLPGTFVDVQVFGNTVSHLVSIPRHAVHEGGTVWVAEDGVLRIREVEIVRSDRVTTFIGGGLADGDQIIVTPLDAVTDGMKVRVVGTPGDEDTVHRASDNVATLGSMLQVPARPTHPRFQVPPTRPEKNNLQPATCNLQPTVEGVAV